MRKKIISLITDLDIIQYVDSLERKQLLQFFDRGEKSFISKMKTFPDKTRVLAYLDCIVKFPNNPEVVNECFPKWCFGSRIDILDKYAILGKDPVEFRTMFKKLGEKNQVIPIEKIEADVKVKFAYQLLKDSQRKIYDEQYQKLGLVYSENQVEYNEKIEKLVNEYNQKKDEKNER